MFPQTPYLKISRYGIWAVFYEQAEKMYIKITSSCHVETVVLLSKGEIDSKKVRVEFSL